MMLYVFLYYREPCSGKSLHLMFTADHFTDQGKDYFNVYLPDTHDNNMKKTWVAAPSESMFISWVHDWDAKASENNEHIWISNDYVIGSASYFVRGNAFSGSWAAEAAELLSSNEVAQ